MLICPGLLTHGIERLTVHFHVDVVACRFLLVSTLNAADEMVDDDRIWRVKERVESLRNLGKLHPGAAEDLLHVLVAPDELPLLLILQFVGLDVLPESRDDHGPRLSVDAQEAGQTRVQAELERLVVEQEEDGAANVAISGSLHLEPIRLLGGGRAMPLHQMIVRAVQVLVQLDHERLEERGKLALHFSGVHFRGVVQ